MTGSTAHDGTRPEVEVGRRYWRVRRLRRAGPDVFLVAIALAIGVAVVALLERVAGVDSAAAAFLLAVVAVAVLRGTGPAVATAVGSFLLYDFLFIEPYYTLTVNDPTEWLNLLLLLVVGVVVGRLAGRERDRAMAAIEGEREALALFNVSFTLASERDPTAALSAIARMVRDEIRATRVWVVEGEAVVADTAPAGSSLPGSRAVHSTLRRRPGDEPAEWVRVHAPSRTVAQQRPESAFRVAITADGISMGAIWAIRPREMGDPDDGEKRVLAAAADQIGGSLQRERLQRDATSAEISRRSDALKSALLDSVSHDLRTPLASIRAAAGTLMDPDIDWPAEQRREIAGSIDREAEWLNRLVTNLLDMSRVEAGELRPTLVVLTVDDVVAEAVRRMETALGDRIVEVQVPPDLPPVLVDEVFIGQVLNNTLDNAAKYAGPGAPVRVSARETDDHRVRITIEDGGPGVPPESMPRLFEKFYRVPRKGEGSRRGTGIGLAVVRGLVDAMGGTVAARPSELGGLAVDVDVPIAADEPSGDPDAGPTGGHVG
jgi:two-component system, OmpR family, sensor histidine kinase KdpD